MKIYYVGLNLSLESVHNMSRLFPSIKHFHCTLIYSRNWFPYKRSDKKYIINSDLVVDIFNYKKVLRFSHLEVSDRHLQLIDTGATTDYPEYKPHITIADQYTPITKLPNFSITLENEYYQTWEEL